MFRKKLECCARKYNQSVQVVNIDTSAADEGYMGMEFLDNQSENQYLNTIDRENRFQNSKYNEHRYAKLSSRLAPENPCQSLETTSD